ncbi:protease [Paenibacillus guangzhouensis]|uniref:protease n=1 Tax=Paenibacillus guangzhouensis TaxID=1473112 RepID=UPI001266A231|nr:protease [Paenibacillus guangzhouensis]
MVAFYWGCLAFGALFALISVVLGDILSSAFDGLLDFLSIDFLQPMVIATAITTLGGAGILLTKYSTFSALICLGLAIVIALLLAVAVFFAYVKPMQNSENSTGFSIQDLQGKIGQVTVAIPSSGFGEVLVRIGAGHTNQIAASFDAVNIADGSQVVVVEIREGVAYVSPLTL